MEQTLSKYLQRDVHPMKKISLSGEKRISKQKEVIERQAVQQAKLRHRLSDKHYVLKMKNIRHCTFLTAYSAVFLAQNYL